MPPKKKGNKGTKTQRQAQEKEFKNEVLKIGRRYSNDLSGLFALTKVDLIPPLGRKRTLVKPRRCVRWGIDPTTGRRICIDWEEISD
ncbi:MAG: hypothetical protein KC587_12230 [Nitrospira sp.]|nr:hypothetical protein [Nitrospira sp.]MCA9457423.1 hypothetical protein [Nitrospira sp.]MCW5783538.1 hypothetical protein [Nitrospirales bacterium]